MSIDKLKEIEHEAGALKSKSNRHQSASHLLAKMRNSSIDMWSQIDTMRRWNFGADELARDAVVEVLEEMKIDIYRIAEMRLQAKARELKVKAAQREAVLHSCILPLPDMEES